MPSRLGTSDCNNGKILRLITKNYQVHPLFFMLFTNLIYKSSFSELFTYEKYSKVFIPIFND